MHADSECMCTKRTWVNVCVCECVSVSVCVCADWIWVYFNEFFFSYIPNFTWLIFRLVCCCCFFVLFLLSRQTMFKPIKEIKMKEKSRTYIHSYIALLLLLLLVCCTVCRLLHNAFYILTTHVTHLMYWPHFELNRSYVCICYLNND